MIIFFDAYAGFAAIPGRIIPLPRSIVGLHNLVANKIASKKFVENEAKEAAEAKKAKAKEAEEKAKAA